MLTGTTLSSSTTGATWNLQMGSEERGYVCGGVWWKAICDYVYGGGALFNMLLFQFVIHLLVEFHNP